MRRFLFLVPALALLAPACGVARTVRPDWTCYPIFEKGAAFSVESRSAEEFVIRAKRLDVSFGKTGALAIANVNREMWTHNRFVMEVRSLNGKRVGVGVTVSHPGDGGKTVMSSAPGLEVSGRAWRQVVFGLDTDFGLGDRNIKIVQLKIGAWVGHWKSGEEGGIEVRGVRLVGPSEVAATSVWRPGDTFESVPTGDGAAGARRKRFRGALAPQVGDALKVFFAFDNEDIVDSFSVRRKFFDRQQYGGFREKLLEHLDGQAVVTTNLAEAGAIVYSRCAKDPELAAAIAQAVTERGVPLYAASEVIDPEIEAILPCALSHDAPEDLPARARIVAADQQCFRRALAADLSDAAFGIYRTCRAKPDATTLLAFANGTPAVVEGIAGKGRVLYSMVAIGQSLVPGKESPDAFFVRLLGHLTGRTLPERPRVAVGADAEGWRSGIGEGMFGRFGWEIGSGLLVESVGARLAVKHGSQGYAFSVPSGSEADPARGRAENGGRRVTFAGDRADPLSLGGEVAVDGAPAFRVDMSLAYPGVRWQFRRKVAELHLVNLNAFAYVPVGGGRVVSLETEEIPADGWSAPWLLLYNGSEQDAPLLLVLQRRPARIEVMRRGAAVEGLRFVAQGEKAGVFTPTWIYGAATCDTTGWTRDVPEEAKARTRRWAPSALAYPIRCRERFRIDRAKGRVEIRARYGYIRSADDWDTPPRPYAPVSPVAWAMRGALFETEDDVRSTGLVTGFGDFAVRDGATEVRYSLRLQEPDLSALPHVKGFAEVDAVANGHFEHGVRFTCGGGIKVDYAKDKGSYAAGRVPAARNCNMHGQLLGLCQVSSHPFVLTEGNRRLMRRRLTWRMLEPLETMTYKMACRWRREPTSGVDYAIYMNSPRDISTRYSPETYGSKIIYGDSNETTMMILDVVRRLEDQYGQAGLAKANWDTLSRYVPSFPLADEDWAMMASGCLEWGGSGSIDMLNCEFAAMQRLARLAELAGDEEMREQALYRAARKACPTLARLRMLDYFTRHGLLSNAAVWRASVGYNEEGATFQVRTRPVHEMDLFDMSQGIPRDLVALYGRQGWAELRRDYFPHVRTATVGKGLKYATAAVLAIGDDLKPDELRARLDACLADEKTNARLQRDWPGMTTGYYAEHVLNRLANAPVLSACRSLYLHDATYDPATGKLTLDVTPNEGAELSVSGKPVSLDSAGTRQTLSL